MTVALRQFITQIINQALEKRSTNQQVKNIISPTKPMLCVPIVSKDNLLIEGGSSTGPGSFEEYVSVFN